MMEMGPSKRNIYTVDLIIFDYLATIGREWRVGVHRCALSD
jgi:hypothetical protein